MKISIKGINKKEFLPLLALLKAGEHCNVNIALDPSICSY